MTLFSRDKSSEQDELVGRLCNEDLDAAGRNRLSELLANDVEAQNMYVCYLDLQVAIRTQAQSLDDEDFALLETQAALDAFPTSCSDNTHLVEHDGTISCPGKGTGEPSTPAIIPFAWRWERLRSLAHRPLAWTATAAVLLVGFVVVARERSNENPEQPPSFAERSAPAPLAMIAPARLRGTVGARWAGAKLELPEGELFTKGQRLELIEGLAEVCFSSGASVLLQGPAIFQIRDDHSASMSVGRIATVVPKSAARFTVHTSVADLTSQETEFGAEVDVDASLITRVYSGDVEMQFNRGAPPAAALHLAGGEGAQVDAISGRAAPLAQPNSFHFVRYLPNRETLINLADVVAGGDGLGDGLREAYHRGIDLLDGRPVDDYSGPAQGDGLYHKAQGFEFVDGVFVPNGKRGPVQVDSIGRHFSGFPATAGDCWGGAIMARRPKEEDSLPFIRLEFHGDTYGYVNWLHIASKPDELSPKGHGLIGMHSNCGITFDLHAIRARHPNKKIVRFRSLVGNLESKAESKSETYAADAWVIVDGQLRHLRQGFSREDGPEAIDVPLADRDRFLVLAVTDAGGDTAYDWVAFGDAVIEMTNFEGISADAEFIHLEPQSSNYEEAIHSLPGRAARNDRAFSAFLELAVNFFGWSGYSCVITRGISCGLVVSASGYGIDSFGYRTPEEVELRTGDGPGRTCLAVDR